MTDADLPDERIHVSDLQARIRALETELQDTRDEAINELGDLERRAEKAEARVRELEHAMRFHEPCFDPNCTMLTDAKLREAKRDG